MFSTTDSPSAVTVQSVPMTVPPDPEAPQPDEWGWQVTGDGRVVLAILRDGRMVPAAVEKHRAA